MTSFALAIAVLTMPQTPQDFPDSVFKIPVYPGAVKVERSSQRLMIDKPIGWAATFQRMSKGWGRMYTSKDDFNEVGAFLIKEGNKLGKYVPHKTGNNPTMLMLEFKLPNKDAILTRIDSIGKGKGTRYEMYYFIKAGT